MLRLLKRTDQALSESFRIFHRMSQSAAGAQACTVYTNL